MGERRTEGEAHGDKRGLAGIGFMERGPGVRMVTVLSRVEMCGMAPLAMDRR